MQVIDDIRFVSRGERPVTLVGKLHRFDDDRPRPATLVCHPSSRGEAHFNHPIVRQIASVLHDAGWVVLRFNLRGIPPSGGAISKGRDEPDDIRGALDFLEAVPTADRSRIYVVGHSFGGAMALTVASQDERVRGGISLGFPLRALDPTVSGGQYLYDCDREAALNAIRAWRQPKVFITGESDHSGPAVKMTEFFLTLAEPKTFLLIGGADHFFGQGQRRNLDHPGLIQAVDYVRRTLSDWAGSAG